MIEPMYLSPDGTPLDVDEWRELFDRRGKGYVAGQPVWRRVTVVSGVRVSTVWLGLDHSWGAAPPLYWETMIFGGEHDQEQWRYSSREQALDDHERIVRALRAGEAP